MNLIEIFSILFIHWIADFVLQTDEQAKGKSSNNILLGAHVLVYSLVWAEASIIYRLLVNNNWILLFGPITFICHFITDYFTSRINKSLWNKGKTHEFFVSVGFDQILHYIQLFITYYLLTR